MLLSGNASTDQPAQHVRLGALFATIMAATSLISPWLPMNGALLTTLAMTTTTSKRPARHRAILRITGRSMVEPAAGRAPAAFR
jgi:hypothetical protein